MDLISMIRSARHVSASVAFAALMGFPFVARASAPTDSYSAAICQESNGSDFVTLATGGQASNTGSSSVTLYCPVNRDLGHQIDSTNTAPAVSLYGWANANGYGSVKACRLSNGGGNGSCGTAATSAST